ncbi:MAG: type VI secretion system contractile sheath domain-containing protein [Planctomycetota bacterium]|jgi:type VI secretion system protein ImpC
MDMQFSPEKMEFELGTLTSFAPQKARDDTPFCILLLADFSGRGNRGLCETGPVLAGRRRIAVDVDNLDALPMRLDCEISIAPGAQDGPRIPVRFDGLDDFHPDQIFDRLELFQKLKMTRKLLSDPATFAQAASQVRSWVGGQEQAHEPEPAQAQSGAEQGESNADAIERLLGQRPGQKPRSAPAGRLVDIDALIRQAVKPYIVPAPDPQQAELVAQVEQAVSGQMRGILHHPDFQEIEAAWRMLQFLVSQVETDETLKLYVVDVSKAELAADLASANQWQSTGIYRLLVEQTVGAPGAEPYAVLVGGYRFDKTVADVNLLRHLARVAQAAGAPLLAEAHGHFAGCESLAVTPDPDNWRRPDDPAAGDLWQEFRRSPEAASAALVLPRFLLRLPYGRDTDPIDRFDFEEFSPMAGHQQYLWGSGAAVCASLLAMAFRESGWSLTNALGRDLPGLPMHIYKSDGDSHVTPCAETFLTERAMQVLLAKGLMPLLSIRGQDAVRVPRFQSIAEPPTALAGRWR